MNRSSQGPAGTTTARNSQVPRPPANYTYRAPSGTAQQSAPSRQSAPSQHAAPQGNSNGTPRGNSSGSSHGSSNSTSRASGSVPRPASGYSYHAAPAYSGSSSYAAGRTGTGPYAGSRGGSYPYSPPALRATDRVRLLCGAMDRVRPTPAAATALRVPTRRRTIPVVRAEGYRVLRRWWWLSRRRRRRRRLSWRRWRWWALRWRRRTPIASLSIEEAIAALGGLQRAALLSYLGPDFCVARLLPL